MTPRGTIVALVGAFVLVFAAQAYWTYATSQFLRAEHEMERVCDRTNPHDWIVEWYQWGNYASLVVLVWAAVALATTILRFRHAAPKAA